MGERDRSMLMKVKDQHRPQGPKGSLQAPEAGEAGEIRPCGLRNTAKMLVLPGRANRGRGGDPHKECYVTR